MVNVKSRGTATPGIEKKVQEISAEVTAIDQRYQEVTGLQEFGVFLRLNDGGLALRAKGPSVVEMVIAAAALAAVREDHTLLVCPIDGTGEPRGVVTIMGHPYAVAGLWAEYSCGGSDTVVRAVLDSSLEASKVLVDLYAMPAHVSTTEH